jgi:hypothetical protein
MIKYAIANFNPPLILAYTDPANAASNRVLEKCGFARNGMESVATTESLRWEITCLSAFSSFRHIFLNVRYCISVIRIKKHVYFGCTHVENRSLISAG